MRLFAGTPFDRPPVCERCENLESECQCPPETLARNLVPPGRQTVRLTVEKRRKGKVVTVVHGLSAGANDLPALLSRFKGACGAGGTVAGDLLEIQGDHRDRLGELLSESGYKLRD